MGTKSATTACTYVSSVFKSQKNAEMVNLRDRLQSKIDKIEYKEPVRTLTPRANRGLKLPLDELFPPIQPKVSDVDEDGSFGGEEDEEKLEKLSGDPMDFMQSPRLGAAASSSS